MAFLIATPEYTNSIPGVAKNAIDWLSRPAGDISRVFSHKPVVVMGATPGPNGTLLAQSSWLPVLRALGTEYWSGGRMLVRGAGKVVTHKQLLTAVWGPAHEHDVHYLRVFVGQLRQKIEPDPAQPALILTEPGVGYRWMG